MELLNTWAGKTGVKGAALALLLALGLSSPAPLQAQSADQREYALKAVFLYNFCQFIEWPPSSFIRDGDPIVIGIMGTNPFGSLLSETVQGEMVRGRSIRLELCQKLQDAMNCHLIFISDIEMRRQPDLAAQLRGRSVVTVGESDAFLDRGGMIALSAVENRIKLKVNLAAAKAAKVEISSKLLRVADIRR